MRPLIFLLTAAAAFVAACSSKTNPNPDSGPPTGCAQDLSVGWTNYALCAAGTGGNLAPACPTIAMDVCVDTRPVAACCAWAANPSTELARAPASLHYNGQPTGMPSVDVSCVDTPPTPGTPMMVTLQGYVKMFLGQDGDSAGVKIQVLNANADGSLGSTVSTAATTDMTSPSRMNTWLQMCPTGGCTERQYTIMNVPTETPLVIHTSDNTGAGKWTDFYDYNIYFSNAAVSGGMVAYDTTGVGSDDVLTVLSTVGDSLQAGKGLLAGEVHDCGDVRLQNAEVNTDYRPEGDIFYFGSDETYPIPDTQATSTSDLGLFGGVNYTVGVPIQVSAVGMYMGQKKLIGSYTVQVFDGAVTGLSLRGRRPFQHD